MDGYRLGDGTVGRFGGIECTGLWGWSDRELGDGLGRGWSKAKARGEVREGIGYRAASYERGKSKKDESFGDGKSLAAENSGNAPCPGAAGGHAGGNIRAGHF